MSVLCKLCDAKRAKRFCPGISAEICPSCCGAERENTIDCPSGCDYLRESRRHAIPPPLDPKSIPNTDVNLTEAFLHRQEPIIMYLCLHVRLAMEKARAADLDAREALEGMIQTLRTAQSGLIYEAKTPNPYAAAIQDEVKKSLDELRKMLAEQQGMEMIRDADILGCLVFVQRLELQYNNGRRKSRAFFDFLRASLPVKPGAESEAVEEPRIQL